MNHLAIPRGERFSTGSWLRNPTVGRLRRISNLGTKMVSNVLVLIWNELTRILKQKIENGDNTTRKWLKCFPCSQFTQSRARHHIQLWFNLMSTLPKGWQTYTSWMSWSKFCILPLVSVLLLDELTGFVIFWGTVLILLNFRWFLMNISAQLDERPFRWLCYIVLCHYIVLWVMGAQRC